MPNSMYDGLGFKSLLTNGDKNPKTAKSNSASDYFTVIQHFSHAATSGFGNLCASASPGCIAACLDDAGHGGMESVKRARRARTKLFMQDRKSYFIVLVAELEQFKRKADRLGKRLAVRLNGTSDIMWEKVSPWLFTNYPDVQFYDYTKHVKRCMKSYSLPDNYHLTFSRSEINEAECRKVLRSGKCNVAVVFANKDFPPTWAGKSVYSMDDTDLRFLDPPGGCVGGLYAKGGAYKDHSEFILPTPTSG